MRVAHYSVLPDESRNNKLEGVARLAHPKGGDKTSYGALVNLLFTEET
jgi:hypothetical protein